MNRLFFPLVLFLVLLSPPLVGAASSSDFVKLQDGDVNYFTHKDLVDSRYVVGSDNIFYGSKEGEITMKLYLKDKIASGDYKFGLKTRSKNINITSVGVGKQPSPILSAVGKAYDHPDLISLDSSITEVTIVIEFDPTEIGLLEEFDVILYNDKDEILVTYDPFISGFGFRQQLTIGTSSIGLSGDVTRDHTILVYVPPGNDYWTSDTCGDGTGITFAQSDEITELDFDVEDFNVTDQNYFIWMEETETFPSATDVNAWFYYEGTCVDNSDGPAAYPTDYNAVYHLNENSAYQDAKGVFNETGSSVTRNTTCLIGKCASFNGTNQFVDFGTTLGNFGTGEFSYTARINQATTGANQHHMGKRIIATDTQWSRLFYSGGNDLVFELGSAQVLSASSMTTGEWISIGGTRGTGTLFQTYINGDQNGGSGSNSEDVDNAANFTIGASDDLLNDYDGLIDEVRVYDYVLSSDEMLLLHNSDIDNLITFGAQEVGLLASFTVSGTGDLDPDQGINSVDRNFTNTSTPIDANFFWSVDSVQESTDVNFTRSFTSAGDFNISLLMDSAGITSQADETITIGIVVQNVDINFSRNIFDLNTADVNFGVIFDGNATAFNWGFPGDQNQLTQNIQKTFSINARQEVCVTITSAGDANSTTCEFFNIGRVLTKVPLDITNTALSLTPYDIEVSVFPPQTQTGLLVDANLFVFSELSSFDSQWNIDFNTDYFGTSRLFTFTDNNLFFEFQPYLVAQTNNLESTIFTINNPEGRKTLTGIKITSTTLVGSALVEVESKVSDGSGQAVFHFVKGKTYILNFSEPDGTFIFSETIEANDTQFFAFIDLQLVSTTPSPVGSVAVEWNPTIGNVIPVDGNINVFQILRPTNVTIGDVNVFVTYLSDTNVFFDQVFTLDTATDANLSYGIPITGLDSNFTVKVHLQIFDSDGLQIGNNFTNTYSFASTFSSEVFDDAKNVLGEFVVAILAIFISVFLIGMASNNAIGEDRNPIGIAAIILTGVFVIVGWIPFTDWGAATMLGVGAYLWSVKR